MKFRKGWQWVPTLYFAEGLPYALIINVSVIMYKNLNVPNSMIALYTSWFYLPWVIKPLWSPLVDLTKSKRWWITTMQTLLAVGFGAVALTIPTSFFLQTTIAILWLMAFFSATHDIAADGFYMLAQTTEEQSFFVGIRNICYRVAMIFGQGLLVMCAGLICKYTNSMTTAWSLVFGATALLLLLIAIYHKLRLPQANEATESANKGNMASIFLTFFKKKNICIALSFILLYRFGEALLTKMASPFLLDNVDAGGLQMTNEEVGLIYGTVGVVAQLGGGLIGGIVASRDGLKRWLWPMIIAMNLPNVVYVAMAVAQPSNFVAISAAVAAEQMGYGFGFTAFTLFLIQFSQGEYKTAHYALCTGFMALGMMLPGMISGYLQELLGYEHFFVVVLICCLPGMIIAHWLHIDEQGE